MTLHLVLTGPDDDRTAKYTAEPLTKVQNFDYSAYEAANK